MVSIEDEERWMKHWRVPANTQYTRWCHRVTYFDILPCKVCDLWREAAGGIHRANGSLVFLDDAVFRAHPVIVLQEGGGKKGRHLQHGPLVCDSYAWMI